MLAKIGVNCVDDLYDNVPAECWPKGLPDLPTTKSELDVERIFVNYAKLNHAANDGPFFLGAGVYYHHIPATVDYIIQRSEFLTSYTPYQPEVSQGTLQYVFEFQSMVAALTGMEIANASMYDGSTSVTEAALMAKRITKREDVKIFGELHPQYRETLETYFSVIGGNIASNDPDESTACVIVQSPDFHGEIHDLTELRKKCDESGALLIVVVAEIVSLGLLPAPEVADIVVGECQSVGIPMMYGGPYAGFFACSKKHVRQMPGRICGETVDVEGRRSFVLTMNTREQHIRREKATSNICTNQGLCALAFTVHLSLLGEEGLKHLAKLNHQKACKLADALATIEGVTIQNKTFFNEFVAELPIESNDLVEKLAANGIIAGYALGGNRLLISATEMTTDSDVESLINAIKVEVK